MKSGPSFKEWTLDVWWILSYLQWLGVIVPIFIGEEINGQWGYVTWSGSLSGMWPRVSRTMISPSDPSFIPRSYSGCDALFQQTKCTCITSQKGWCGANEQSSQGAGWQTWLLSPSNLNFRNLSPSPKKKSIQKLHIKVYAQKCLAKMLFIIAKPGERIQTPNNTIIEK